MIGVEATIARAFAAYQRGDLASARQTLMPVNHRQAWHLLGLVERKAGRLGEAQAWLAKAAEADRQNPEIPNNQGRVAMDAGKPSDAEHYFRRALSLRASWQPALKGLARSLNEQRKWDEAAPVWAEVLASAPTDRVARFGAATAALERGELDAADVVYSALLDEGVSDPAAVRVMRGRTRVELSQVEAGLADLAEAWRLKPDAYKLRILANTLWMSGDTEGFDALLNGLPMPLQVLGVDLLGQAEKFDAALAAWQALAPEQKGDPHALAVKAVLHRETGDGPASLEAAERAYQLLPNDAYIVDAFSCAQLMVGDGAGALATIAPWRERLPNSQHWLAYEATALRLLGDPRYEALVRLDAHVRAYELPVPEGFASIDSFNDAFMDALDRTRGFKTHPLNQSLRLGAQTSRDLVSSPDPVIQAYIRALDTPIRAFMRDMGDGTDHPMTARNTGQYRFNGAWSVRLASGGRHVNHIHSEGWISSAYYACVPDETRRGDSKAGWIKFGEPPFVTTPALPPQKWIQPEAGILVLFPSFLWHGTEPIHDGSTRVTAPFDVVPA